jgi:hypothetical protein
VWLTEKGDNGTTTLTALAEYGGDKVRQSLNLERAYLRKTLVVFCEGERTEPEYLDALKRQPSVRDAAAVDLRVETGHGGSVPRRLVIHWDAWTRRHQARSRWFHKRARLARDVQIALVS